MTSRNTAHPHRRPAASPARRALAGLAALGVLGVGSAAGAFPAQADGNNPGTLAGLGACVADKGKLDVILLMDETESLIHNVKDGIIQPTVPGSDAEHNRVPAAQSFVDDLLKKADDEDFTARIKLAGFGQEYHSTLQDPEAYGDWVDLDSSGAETMKKLIDGERDRTSELYTNYANALTGAYQDFARSSSPDACKLLVTFTDGALTAAGGYNAAPAAQQDICRPGGIADQYRAGGITNIGIGLSDPKNPSDFSLYKSITQGDGGVQCGTQPANGAFFPADSVGSLFGSFHRVLSTGGDFSKETRADEGFTFVLDRSVDSVRFTAVAQDDLGEGAYLVLTSPSGKTLELKGQGTGQVGSADVTWQAAAAPVHKVDGEMRLTNEEDWEGKWTMEFTGFDTASRDGRVFNSVRIQPDLQVQIAASGDDATATAHGLAVRSDDEVTVSLVGRDGQPRTLDGDANVTVQFTPSTGGEAVDLVKDTPIGAGDAVAIPLDGLGQLPANGHLDASVQVTTKGVDDAPGTELEPVIGRTDFAVADAEMPQAPAAVDFQMKEPVTTIEVPVQGPGRVWVEEGSVMDAALLPEGIDAVTVSSEYGSKETALEIPQGETKILPVTVSVPDLKDGLVQGTLPIHMAKLDGTGDTTAALPADGQMSVPLNKGIFAVALVTSLLLALLIPLALTYLVRYLTAKIPAQYYGGLRIPLKVSGDRVLYNGKTDPHISIDEAARNQLPTGDQRSAVVRGYPLQVKAFGRNPLQSPYVEVDAVPSIAGDGAQVGGAAKLPLAIHNTWFIATDPSNSNHLDLVVIPRLPLDATTRDALVEDISANAPGLVETLRKQAAALEEQARVAATSSTDAADAGAAPEVPNPFAPADDAPATPGDGVGTGMKSDDRVLGAAASGLVGKLGGKTATDTPATPAAQQPVAPAASPGQAATPAPKPTRDAARDAARQTARDTGAAGSTAAPASATPAPGAAGTGGSASDATPATPKADEAPIPNPFAEGADEDDAWNPYATEQNPFGSGGLNFDPGRGDDTWGDELPWDPTADTKK
ncbi:hypothetical protein C1Y63_10710 [Corynebacterium sp. 13CS0277]|uniref:vWA domain-containing protein n=1 Tax=Corynebacterium sp. 13CS0277 TaxID=2071994 RepID=UPI000D02D666|nr:vWA domain-containing protein [Corynebacterium sp. 13CS0277]PRQ10576.1 hypothetical protein C1Y63_10710 [Corynebacterium sp. 13CS0277]